MKILQIILTAILLLILFVTPAVSEQFIGRATASISATATVVPMLGFMPEPDEMVQLDFKRKANNLLLQSPKNTSLIMHIENAKCTYQMNLNDYTGNRLVCSERSASDVRTIDLSMFIDESLSGCVVTILYSEN